MSSSTVTSRATRVTILAPVRGVLVPMETIPDPVFAQKLVGEGISIDPLEGRLHAPVAGEVSHLHPSAHALTLRTPEGLEILVHIGLDTVRLRGEGFTTHVRMGDSVRAGDLLISFDLDHLALHAKSLLTQVVVTNTAMITSLTPRTGAVSVGDPVADITLPGAGGGSGDGADTAAAGQRVTSPAILVPNPSGLHARPAATLANQAQQFRSQIWLVMNDVQVNAKSIMAVMGLEVTAGATVRIVASGPDAEQAAETLSAAVAAGLGEEIGTSPVSVTPVSVRSVPATVPPAPSVASAVLPAATPVSAPAARPGSGAAGQHSSRELRGAAASPGLAVGTIVQVRREDVEVTEEATDHHRGTPSPERRDRPCPDTALGAGGPAHPGGRRRQGGHLRRPSEILRDPDLLDLAASGIDKGKSAAYAWRAAYRMYADRLAGLKNEVLAGRAIDVRDVGQRVLRGAHRPAR